MFAQTYALLVGISEYMYQESLNLPKLQWAHADACLMRDALLQIGLPLENIVCLCDSQASRQNILDKITKINEKVSADGLVILFFACHACKADQSVLLLPHDVHGSSLHDRGIIFPELAQRLTALKVRHKVIFLDVCHSGHLGQQVLLQSLHSLTESHTALVTAGGDDQVALELTEEGHGLFALHLIEALCGLGGSDDSRSVTVNHVIDYLNVTVPQDAVPQQQQPHAVLWGARLVTGKDISEFVLSWLASSHLPPTIKNRAKKVQLHPHVRGRQRTLSLDTAEEFILHLKEINLRFALGDIDAQRFEKMHQRVVFERLSHLIVNTQGLKPYFDMFLRGALPVSKDTPPENLVNLVDEILLGDLTVANLLPGSTVIDRLERVKIEEQHFISPISYGVECLNKNNELSFAPIIPAGLFLPLTQSYARTFCLAWARQEFVRIPLGFQIGEGSEPIRMDGVEFTLPGDIRGDEEWIVTLEPEPNRLRITFRCPSSTFFKEALLPFDDMPLDGAEPPKPDPPDSDAPESLDTPIPPRPDASDMGDQTGSKLREQIFTVLEKLVNFWGILPPQQLEQVIVSVRAAASILRRNDSQILRQVLEQVLQHNEDIRNAARFYFGGIIIESLYSRRPGSFLVRQHARSLQKRYEESYTIGDFVARDQAADEFDHLVTDALLDAAHDGRSLSDGGMDAFVFQAYLSVTRYTSIRVMNDHLAVFKRFSTENRLEPQQPLDEIWQDIEGFVSSPVVLGLSIPYQEKLKQDIERIRQTETGSRRHRLDEAILAQMLRAAGEKVGVAIQSNVTTVNNIEEAPDIREHVPQTISAELQQAFRCFYLLRCNDD